MENKWLLYEKTLQNMYNNQKIFMNMLIYYYKLVIIDKHNNKEYIKENYPKQNIGDLELFNEYIVETKNLGIFTIFNNIPDIIHPLENDYYTNYGMYVSFIKPEYFKKSENDDILILDKNMWKYSSEYSYPYSYQDVAPYNKYKKYIYLNIKYFDIEKYKDYLIIIVNNNNETYIYDNNIIKKKTKKEWIIMNKNEIDNNNLIYACVLRKINKDDILNVFNVNKTIKKDTLLYALSEKPYDKELKYLNFFSFNKDDYLNDPYKTLYKSGDELYLHTIKVKKDYTTINLTCDILSNNKLNKTKKIESIEPIETLLNVNKSNNLDIKKYSNYIYNGNMNYMYYYKNHKLIWNNNKGKRLLYEIFIKSSNFINYNYFYRYFLEKYEIYHFVYSCGYYNKLNLFHNYEIYHKIDDDELEFIKIEKVIMDKSY